MQACHNRRLGALPPHQITDYRVELHFSHFRQALSRGWSLELEVKANQFASTMMCQRPTTFVQEKDVFSVAQNPRQNVVCVMENDMMRKEKSTGGLKRGAEQSGSNDQPQAHAFEGDKFAHSSESRKDAGSRNDGIGPNCWQGCQEVHVPVSIFLPRDLVIVNFKKENSHAAAGKAAIAVATRGPRESLEPKGKMQLQTESKLTSTVKRSRLMCDRRSISATPTTNRCIA